MPGTVQATSLDVPLQVAPGGAAVPFVVWQQHSSARALLLLSG